MPKVSPSVLIIRLDGIGDALALAPLLAALRRRAIPTDVVLRDANAAVFAPSAVRRIIPAPFALRSSARSNVEAIERLGRDLQTQPYSHVLVATEDPGGYRLAGTIDAPVRLGFADPFGKPFKALWTRRFLTGAIYRTAGLDRRGPHECEVVFRLGTSLLDEPEPTRNLAELRPLVLEAEPQRDERVAIQITDKWERLGIAFDDVIAAIRRIAAMGPARLIAARSEATYGDRVAYASGYDVTYFEALEPWKAAIGAAPVILTPDSGALHVAGMTGTPVVAIFPARQDSTLQIARWAPWAAPHRIVRADAKWPARAAEALAELLST